MLLHELYNICTHGAKFFCNYKNFNVGDDGLFY